MNETVATYYYTFINPDKEIHRSHIPMQNTERPKFIAYDAKDSDSKFPPIPQLRPPAGATNVLLILIDDAGFSSSSAFDDPCRTPNAESLAANGLNYNRFHTTALCSPSRQALLTGRNHHSAGMGGITEITTGAPGYCSVLQNTMSPIAKTLKLNGYSTAQFGKCHEVPVWQTSSAGPFDAWPTGEGGFEYFYGFIGGEANQWYSTLFEGTTPVEPGKTPEEGYHFMEDMTEKAIKWISQQKVLVPVKPYFVYFAPGATHAPHPVPNEWADKYKGKFDKGWDKLREETFARQKELSVIPKDCKLTVRPDDIPAWNNMPEDFKPFLCREMEVFAGFLEYTDYQIGKLIDSLKKLDVFEDTLIYYIMGDNGASAEGGINGCYYEMSYFNQLQSLETPEYLTSKIDKLGGQESYNHYAVGWAHAKDTSYQWTKQVASHWDGTRNGTIISWSNGIKAKGEIRSQFTHIIDVAPTVLEAAGIPEHLSVDGIAQDPIESTSMLYSFNDAKMAERHEIQYYNWGGLKYLIAESAEPIPAGEHQVRMEFAYAGGGLGKGGRVTLYTDGKKTGEGDVEATLAIVFSADDGCDIGEDSGAPVSPDYGPQGNAFNGEVKSVQLAISDAAEDFDHLNNPEDAIIVFFN